MNPELLEKVSACALNRLFGSEPLVAARIYSSLGSNSAIFGLSPSERRALLGPYSKFSESFNDGELELSLRELETLEARGYGFLPCSSPDFPAPLLQCEDHPAGLYYRSGSHPRDIFGRSPMISIVGTRDMSPYGKEWCERIVRTLACSPSRPVIVSGLAFGVDITAHMAALACNLPTIAVMPTGINDIYPRSHFTAAGKIAASPLSALVSDFPPGTSPQAYTFLKRNRIIAGLSCATILIESRKSGGGMITARLAFGYGREVFTLPGRIDDPRSEGCNILVAEGVAQPLTSLANLCNSLNISSCDRSKKENLASAIRKTYSGREDAATVDSLVRMAETVKKRRGICVDELCREMEIAYERAALLSGILLKDGIIEMDMLQRCTINYKNA